VTRCLSQRELTREDHTSLQVASSKTAIPTKRRGNVKPAFFSFQPDWGLNSELCSCKAGAPPQPGLAQDEGDFLPCPARPAPTAHLVPRLTTRRAHKSLSKAGWVLIVLGNFC
jgi:hypothetical protein